jgi:hypothetical protein
MDDPLNPIPDPTILTTEALIRAVAAERDYVNGVAAVLRERLNGIDKATSLLSETISRAPTETQEAVKNLAAVTNERFASIVTQFAERDTRSERESRDNKVAVDAAFAAQKEAASEQNKSNTLAITKSEVATTETINKLGDLFKTTTDALGDKIDDLKQRVNSIESARVGYRESEQRQAQGWGSVVAVAGVLAVLASVVVGLLVKFA